jgi:hypothetical protein
MAGFGFGISDFEYVANLGLRLRSFVKSIKDAPKDFDALRAEADCLEVCFHVIEYRECVNVLRSVTFEQAQDLRTIIQGCKTNMTDLVKFVAKCQRIAIDSTGGKPKHKSVWQCFKEWGKDLWAKVEFVWEDKQPMRDKLAIPTQSLNIFLVSLTYVSLSSNTRLSGGPRGRAPVPPKGAEDWDLVGQKVAFKHANFSYAGLMKPGIEDKILECASRIIHCGSCEKCRQGGDERKEKKPGETIKIPKRPRRKSSFGKAINAGPSGLYLVRSKNPAHSRTQIRSSVEIVKADYDFGSDSGSDVVGFDGNYLSQHRSRSPHRHSAREADHAYEDQSPHQESSAGYESFDERREGRVSESRDEEDKEEEAAMQDARCRGHAAARAEIKRERKEAIAEMTEGVVEGIRASQDPSRARLSAEPLQTDIRGYMEVMYGVVIERASPQVERFNASRSRTSGYATRSRMSEGLKESRARTSIHDDVGDSDISSDPDSEHEVKIYVRRESTPKLREESRPTSFAIPRHEYTSRKEGFEGRQTSMADRDREHSLREREMSLGNREHSLREREMSLGNREDSLREREVVLRERERRFQERQRSMGHHDMPFAPRHRGVRINPDLSRPEPPNSTQIAEGGIHLSPEDHQQPMRRPSSYSGSESIQIVRRDSSDDDRSMYGRHEYGTENSRRLHPRSRPRRLNDSDDDDDMSFSVARPRR